MLQTIMGENEGRDKSDVPSVVVHTHPPVLSSEVTGIPAAEAPGARPAWDEDKFLTVPDFTSRFPDHIPVTIARKPSVVFLLLFRPMASRSRWLVPNFETAADFINDALSTIIRDDYPYAETYNRSGKWGLFSTVLLHSSDPAAIE